VVFARSRHSSTIRVASARVRPRGSFGARRETSSVLGRRSRGVERAPRVGVRSRVASIRGVCGVLFLFFYIPFAYLFIRFRSRFGDAAINIPGCARRSRRSRRVPLPLFHVFWFVDFDS
jgi:hypothetical protein